MDLELNHRTAWVERLIRETGTKGIVIGLSGGKDSAAVAAICVKAGVPVLGINMPINSNSEDGVYVRKLDAALKTIATAPFEVRYLEPHQIGDAFTILHQQLGFDREKDQIVLANIKARLRMITLYAFANQRNYLVAGTDNACESFVGYFTKWGDGSFDFNLLGDLTVEEVVQIGIEAGAPEECMRRTPSAGLWEGQTDEGEMGVTYKDIAIVLRHHQAEFEINRHTDYAWGYTKPNGVSDESYKEIMRRHNTTEHKRISPPSYNMFL